MEVTSDAGLIAQAYLALGDRLFAKLRGEFALLIHDRREQVLLALRDVAGCRPLFFENAGDCLYVATEIRQILAGSGRPPRLNEECMVRFLLSPTFEGETNTMYAGVSRILSARTYRFPMSPPFQPGRSLYWSPPQEQALPAGGIPALTRQLRERLERAVARALPPDPFGVSLSGGLDSSTVWSLIVRRAQSGDACAAEGLPYSLVFPGLPCDESRYISSTARKTGVSGELIDAGAARPSAFLDRLSETLDTPVAGPTMYHIDLVAQKLRATGRRVMMTGLGGDEWMGGSVSYLKDDFWSGRVVGVLLDVFRLRLDLRIPRCRLLWNYVLAPAGGVRVLMRGFTPPPWLPSGYTRLYCELQTRLLCRSAHDSHARSELLRILGWLQGGTILEAIEQNAASYGVEIRHPLMDQDLIDFAFMTPAHAFYTGARKKQLLRLAMFDALAADVRERRWATTFESVLSGDRDLMAMAGADLERWQLVGKGLVETAKNCDLRAVMVNSDDEPTMLGYRMCAAEIFLRALQKPRQSI